VKPPVLTTRCSPDVPACVMTMTSAAFVCPTVRSIRGVIATICVELTEATKASLGLPSPISNNTRTGERKFVPVIATCVPPAGGPVAGVTAVIVGMVPVGGGVVG